jgi:hypothetical protein
MAQHFTRHPNSARVVSAQVSTPTTRQQVLCFYLRSSLLMNIVEDVANFRELEKLRRLTAHPAEYKN